VSSDFRAIILLVLTTLLRNPAYVYHLMKSGSEVGSARLSFSVHGFDDAAVLAATRDLNEASVATSALTDPRALSPVLSAVDNVNALAPVLQTAYDDAQSLAEFYAPMKTVLSYLERLVQAVDAASEASGGCKRNDPGILMGETTSPGSLCCKGCLPNPGLSLSGNDLHISVSYPGLYLVDWCRF
jgi:hypothetical protein